MNANTTAAVPRRTRELIFNYSEKWREFISHKGDDTQRRQND